MDICLFLFFFPIYLRKQLQTLHPKDLFDTPAEFYGKIAIPFPFPPEHITRLHFRVCLAIIGHVTEVGQYDMVDMMSLPEHACMYVLLSQISLLAPAVFIH